MALLTFFCVRLVHLYSKLLIKQLKWLKVNESVRATLMHVNNGKYLSSHLLLHFLRIYDVKGRVQILAPPELVTKTARLVLVS